MCDIKEIECNFCKKYLLIIYCFVRNQDAVLLFIRFFFKFTRHTHRQTELKTIRKTVIIGKLKKSDN